MRSAWVTWAAALAAALVLLLSTTPAHAQCAPSTEGIFPASGDVGTTVNATVTGTGLAGVTTSVFGDAGFAVTVQSALDTTVSLQIVIDANAVPGERFISLETATGTVAVGFTVNPVGGPIVTAVAPTPIATQGFPLDLTISGQNLGALDVSHVTVSGNGVTATGLVASPNSVDLSLDVNMDADVGTHAIVIDSPTGGAVFLLYVQRPAPSIATLSPGAGEIGTTVPLTITGTNLAGAALVITSGSGAVDDVAISDVTTPDDMTLTATLTIDGGLSPESEPRLLIVTTESGQDTAQFFVVAAGVPSVTSISPAAGEPNDTVGVTLRGLNFTGGSLTTSSGSISLQNVLIVDDETATGDVVVQGGATPDTDHPLTITVGMSPSSVDFRVVAPGEPFIGTLSPPFGNRGDTVAMFLDGINLTDVVPGTGVTLSGPKILESNAESLDDETVRVILDLDATASVGFRDVTIELTGGETFTKDASFRVNVPGQIPVITTVSPTVMEPGTTTPVTVTGSNFLGAGITLGGAGATVTSTVVDVTGTTITFDLTLDADAPAESRPLIVVTENGSASCNLLSLAAPIELRAATLLKTGSVFEAITSGYRLFVYEFSINELFETGLRTYSVSGGSLLTLSRLQAENVARAVRDLPFGYLRVRGVTATSQIGASDPHRYRR